MRWTTVLLSVALLLLYAVVPLLARVPLPPSPPLSPQFTMQPPPPPPPTPPQPQQQIHLQQPIVPRPPFRDESPPMLESAPPRATSASLIIQTRAMLLGVFAHLLECDYGMAHDILETAIELYRTQAFDDDYDEELSSRLLQIHHEDIALVASLMDEHGCMFNSLAMDILLREHLTLCASDASRRQFLYVAMHLIFARDLRMQNRVQTAQDNLDTHAEAQGYTYWLNLQPRR